MKFSPFLGILFSGAVGWSSLARGEAAHPNIVVFLADDLSAADIAPYGGKDFPTPNYSRLADKGMRFERAYVASPSCAPSRGALLTGSYPVHNGAMFNHQRVHADAQKWPSYFQALGYEVVAFGKVAHYEQVKDYGFDHAAFFNYHQDICIEKAVEWLNARKSDKPLCFLVGTNWPHVPWPDKLALDPARLGLSPKLADTAETRAARARYASAVENSDRDLGMVMDAVAKNLPGDTFFLFTSDHGSQFPFEKWNLYERGVRVPLIAAWKDKIKPDSSSEAMVSWVDILPTLLEVAGGNPSKDAADIDGESFLPVLLGKADSLRDEIYVSHSGDGNINFFPSRSLRDDHWKYIRNLDSKLEFHTHIDLKPADTGYWPSWVEKAKNDPHVAELVQKYLHRPAEELYDLSSDPNELKNLAADPAHASDLARMRARMDEWMAKLGDHGMATDVAVRPTPNPKTKDIDP